MTSPIAVPSIKLSSETSMPIFGLGTWKSKPGEVTEAVKHAFRTGYRHIDCAALYLNEPEVGEAIKYALQELKIPREEIFITSKLWNSKHRTEDVEPSLRKTLEDFGLDYVDLYLIHWPTGFEAGGDPIPTNADGTVRFDEESHPTDVWLAMEKMLKKGLAKTIGVSNFNSVQVQDILDKGKVKPVINQIEVHPYFPQKKLIDYCTSRGVRVTAYSPFASPDRPWAKPGDVVLLNDPTLKAIGEKHKKSAAQVIIRWAIQRGIAVIPKSVNPERIVSNFNVFDFELDNEDMEKIKSIDRNERFILPLLNGKPRDAAHKHYPFNIEF